MMTVNDLAFERNNQLLFSGINCALQRGELLQIHGANGSGKSTLLRILAGFIAPSAGTIQYQTALHYLGHQHGIKLNLTGRENLRLQLALTTQTTDLAIIDSVITKMRLTTLIDRQARYLSAGQLRRLSLARLLLYPLPLWILDEPTNSLDAENQGLLLQILQNHLDQGGIAIVATHHALSLPNPSKTIRLGELDA